MRIASGVTDQKLGFYAFDSTDLVTPETGLSSFAVYRSRNGGTPAAFTTPTVAEADATNMPGLYWLTLDEDMTIDSGDVEQEMIFHITQASMAPVRRSITIFRPDVTAGETLTVSSGVGQASVQSIANAAITAASIASAAFEAGKFASGAFDAVWSVTARLLTAGTNIVLAKGTGITGFNDLSAAQVNAEADTALADYDPPTNTEFEARTIASASYATSTAQTTAQNDLDILTGADGAVLATSQPNFTPAVAGDIPSANANADALLDRSNGVEAGLTPRGALRLALAALAGKVSGAGTTSNVFRNAVADSKDRITATVDSEGNRTAVTADAS